MKKILKKTLGLTLFVLSTTVLASLPEYHAPEILARANVGIGFNLPEMSFMSNTCPVINNRGDVSFKLMGFGGESNQGLWLKKNNEENGKIIYTAPEMRFITEPSLNEDGKITFNQYDEGVTDGIFTFDAETSLVEQVLKPENEEIAYYTYPQVLTNGKVYFRATNQENIRSYYKFDGSLKSIIAEGETAYGQKSSYLFKPYLNESGAMTFKRRIGEVGQWDESNPDEILVLKPNGTSYESTVVARDRDSDPGSSYLGFANSSSISKSGVVVFTAILEDSRKAIVLSQNGQLTNLVTEKSDDISEIEMFAPKINEQGLVVFRAKDLDGKRGIYVTSLEGTKRLVGEGDEIMTDLGLAKILSNPNYPGFGGDVDMNDHGEIVFYCLVIGAKNNQEWGSAVFKISPQ